MCVLFLRRFGKCPGGWKTFERQTEYRDCLRQSSKERVAQIVEEISNGYYSNPQVEQLLIRLSKRLANTTGKKVYGYLKADVKAIVDEIVPELSKIIKISKHFGVSLPRMNVKYSFIHILLL